MNRQARRNPPRDDNPQSERKPRKGARNGSRKRPEKEASPANRFSPLARVQARPLLRSSATLLRSAPKGDTALIDEVRAYVREFKRRHSRCADCNVVYPPYVLEFDHVDPTTKKFNVGDASSVPSMNALHDEINKCDIVCSNCHKIREHCRGRR